MEKINDALHDYVKNTLPNLDANQAFYENKEDPKTLMRLQNMDTHHSYFSDLCHSGRLQNVSQALLGGPVKGKISNGLTNYR